MKERGPYFCDCGNHAWAILTKGFVSLISVEDASLFEDVWYAFVNQAGNIYAARRNKSKKSLYLHREILKPNGISEVDHVNRNGLDNRRFNIRPASKAQNAANRKKGKGVSLFKGVSLARRPYQMKKPWHATYRSTHLGYFATEEEASAAYMKAARAAFGDFARAA